METEKDNEQMATATVIPTLNEYTQITQKCEQLLLSSAQEHPLISYMKTNYRTS